ncbi:MAG: restriction endonuclease subunit S [Flavobacteriia bacterium]|nr:restriction endonuclease subunit S [Flavobacteriia bacterium]
MEGGKFKNKKLKHIAFLLKGKSITSDKIIEGEFPVIAGGQTSPYSHNEYNYEGNIITVSASGAYSGFVWYHTYPIFASDCTVIFSKDETEISTFFLSEILKTKQQEIYHLQQGAGQPHVYSRDLKELNIPIPPLQKQNEIANYIKEIRKTANSLRKESIQIVDDMKKEIEKMIIG